MAETKVSLKLLVDSKANKVLYAEAGKEFVDFLFHILSLPVGTVVKLLNVNGMVGAIGALCKSVESLSSDYFLANLDKDSLLKPEAAVYVPLLGLNEINFCGNDCGNLIFSHHPNAVCPSCQNKIKYKTVIVPPKNPVDSASSSSGNGSYVKGVVTYMVMDNLEVKPMSTISGITLMNKFNVKDVSYLIEKKVEIGLTEGLAMLNLEVTDTVLTTVFLSKKV